MTTTDLIGKFIQVAVGLAAFAVVLGLVLFFIDRAPKKGRDVIQLVAFLLPAMILVAFGLVYPAIRTTFAAFADKAGNFIGMDNFVWMFTQPEALITLRNTVVWVILVPLVSTIVGLSYAVFIDKSRGERIYKALVFMPLAISFVGAGIIWKFVYEYRGAEQTQIGLLNAILSGIGIEPLRFLQDGPWNTFFLILIMIWIQAGFAMLLLSASIKAIPDDIVEAARLDGVNSWQMFRSITVPSIRPTLVVVLTTISIATLKIFDITRTVTGARFGTQVLANQMYDQSFTFGNNGVGSATAVVIFVLVIPIIVYNVRQMLKTKEVRG